MSQAMIYEPERLFRRGESFSVNQYAEDMRGHQVYHSHNFLEICYVSAGYGYHMIGGQHYTVSKGDLFVLNYDVPHAFYRDSEKDCLLTYNMMFKSKFLDERLGDLRRFQHLAASYLFSNTGIDRAVSTEFIRLRLTLREQEQFGSMFASIYNEYMLRQLGYRSVIRANLIELITKIIRCINNQTTEYHFVNKKAQVIESAVKYLREHYREPFSLDDLAHQTYFSKNYLCKMFKEVTGTTLSQYMQNVRIDEACKMMMTTDKSISQIAEAVGFSDYKAFHIAFRKYKGVSPNKYRKGEGVEPSL